MTGYVTCLSSFKRVYIKTEVCLLFFLSFCIFLGFKKQCKYLKHVPSWFMDEKCLKDFLYCLYGRLPRDWSEFVAGCVCPGWAERRASGRCQRVTVICIEEGLFPPLWLGSTRGESIYRPIGRRNVKNAPGTEPACGRGCWAFGGLWLAHQQCGLRLQPNWAAPLLETPPHCVSPSPQPDLE